MPTLSIIVATSGRPSLARTLGTITPQLLPGDECIIVCDATGDWGHTPRNEAMPRAKGEWLMFMDDDDAYRPGAFDAVRWRLSENPGRPHMFAMIRRGHKPQSESILPRRNEVVCGNVSTQMIVVPNNPSRLGVWGHRYEGDYDFITSTLAKYPPGSLVWCDDVIAEWRANADLR